MTWWAQHGLAQHGMASSDTARHGVAWHSTAHPRPPPAPTKPAGSSRRAGKEPACPVPGQGGVQAIGRCFWEQNKLCLPEQGPGDCDMAWLCQGQTAHPTGCPGPPYLPTDCSAPTGSCVSGGTAELGQSPASMGNLRACGARWELMSGPWMCLVREEQVGELGEHGPPENGESIGGMWGDPSQPGNVHTAHLGGEPPLTKRTFQLVPHLAARPPLN